MGEVYRARDHTLNRDVALKVLPEAFATDPDRLARFRREAQVLASLNHPNIGSIYGLEEAGGIRALVLELVDGPTLADRIARAPIALEEALPMARQICEALEVAHEHGVVHRDLKPANIKLRPDRIVKVLDFGLAKVLAGDGPGPDLSQSPSVTGGGTREGMLLGTPAYMSPEQARGKAVDKRADVWAFGCVLYEMLTGRAAFAGDNVTDVLARIIEHDADFTRCLRRPRRRSGDCCAARWKRIPNGACPTSRTRGLYVRPFPGPGGKWQISADGGRDAIWSRTQRELFYRALDQRIMVAPYGTEGGSFRAGKPRLWSEARFIPREPDQRAFDLYPDGRRVALAAVLEPPESKQDTVVFVFNFFDELRRIAPAGQR